MAKKSDLYSSLWASGNELRGGMDATGRIPELAERYATPLPQLTDEIATLAARVDEHLKRMGATWN
jgi:type I restriction enzyme M protein